CARHTHGGATRGGTLHLTWRGSNTFDQHQVVPLLSLLAVGDERMVLTRVVPLPGPLRCRELEDDEVHRLPGTLEDFELAPGDARLPVVLQNRRACLAGVGLKGRDVGHLLDVGDDVRCHGFASRMWTVG